MTMSKGKVQNHQNERLVLQAMIRIRNLTGRHYPKIDEFMRTAHPDAVRELMNLANDLEEAVTCAERKGRRNAMMGRGR